MKTAKLLLLLLVCHYAAQAQYCGASGTMYCSPDSSLAAPGISDYNNMPCIQRNVSFSGNIQLYFPSTYGALPVDSVHIDSVTNLPCGLCWSNDKTSRMYYGGERGCISISGTSQDSAGSYSLGMYGSVWAGGFVIHGASLGQFWSNYYLYVIDAGGSCTHSASAPVRTACNGTAACTTPVSVHITNALPNCRYDTVKLATDRPYASYIWQQNGDTMRTPTVSVYSGNNAVILSVIDSNHCTGYANVYFGNAGPVTLPEVCYISSDTSLEVPNMIVAFQKNNWFNNVTKYLLMGIDTTHGVSTTHPEVAIAASANGYFRDTTMAYPMYVPMMTTVCNDTQGGSLFTLGLSVLRVDTTGPAPILSWHLQYPYNYSAITVWGRAAGQQWVAKDTIYTNTVVSQLLSYTDINPASSQMEYMLSYDITGSCDPTRSNVTAFTNKAKTYTARPLSVRNAEEMDLINIYPNPATDQLHISMQNMDAHIRIYSVMGDLIYDKAVTSNTSIIDISGFAAGVYTLKAINRSGRTLSVTKFSKN